ncbi:DUF6891 domain-containing protein [Actinomadura sp. 9N407]|uniref:DUF6891 domain-containing protein n=1 Tax=Actinomadura sp. 9N407 TaxID=3375154 RepID=UPI0037B737A1
MRTPLSDLNAREVLDVLYDQLATPVAMAEGTFDEIVEEVIDGCLMIDLPLEIEAGEFEELQGVGQDDLRAWLVDLLRSEFAEHLAWQETLDGRPADGDLLGQAFDELNARAIVAREDFACCQRCGLSEIRDEHHDGEDERARGYVFYHEQDTGRRPLYLTFDTPNGSDESRAALGNEVIGVLREQGLVPEWDGDPRRRIALDVDPRRVRHGELADHPGHGLTPKEPDQATGASTPSLQADGFVHTVTGVRTGAESFNVAHALVRDGDAITIVEQPATWTATGRYTIVDMLVELPHEDGNDLKYYPGRNQILYDTDGHAHARHHAATTAYLLPDNAMLVTKENGLRTGLVFDLPPDAAPSYLALTGDSRGKVRNDLTLPRTEGTGD